MTDKDTSEVDVSGRLHVPNSNRPILKSNKYLSLYNVHLQKQHGINKHVVGAGPVSILRGKTLKQFALQHHTYTLYTHHSLTQASPGRYIQFIWLDNRQFS